MLNNYCGKTDFGGWECARCGNHVCNSCAQKNYGLCPFCMGKLYVTKN